MRKRWWCWAAVLVTVMASHAQIAVAGEKQVCLVCQVKEGSAEVEEVEAFRTYEGKRYGFCSEKCAKEFDADPAAYVPPAFPRPAPELIASDLDGKALTWASFRGKVVLVDFWATWCAPCRKSMPELQALHDKYAERGFTVLGISIDEGGPPKVKKFVATKKFTYPIGLDSDSSPTWDRFRVKAVPAAFLVDRDGRIVAQWTGVPANARELEAKLESLLSVD
jgi:peroxiredoxin/YHS domain-containing protein